MDTGYSLSLNSQCIVLHELTVQTYLKKTVEAFEKHAGRESKS